MGDRTLAPLTDKASLCIPAYNEGLVIRRVLEDLLVDLPSNFDDVVVCANGCTDDTAVQVRAVSECDARVRLLEDSRGKPRAWNRLFHAAKHDVVLFMDADVLPERGALNAILQHLTATPSLVLVGAVDLPTVELSNPRTWTRIIHRPLVHDYLIGRLYGLVRSRFEATLRRKHLLAAHERVAMPEFIIGDDLWVRVVLDEEQWCVARDAVVRYVPGGLEDMLLNMARNAAACEQFKTQLPHLFENKHEAFVFRGNRWRTFWRRLRSPAPPMDKALGLVGFTMRQVARIVYRQRIHHHYNEMATQVRAGRGAEVLSEVGRTRVKDVFRA